MEKHLKWCLKQKKGIKLKEPSENLSKEYLQNAQETLHVLNQIINTNSNMWIATQKYYFEYFLAYSILMKIGIKSEIHSCTILLIEYLEKYYITELNLYRLLKKDKNLRIENQYYLKNSTISINSIELRDLFFKIKNITKNLSQSQIIQIRNNIENQLNQKI